MFVMAKDFDFLKSKGGRKGGSSTSPAKKAASRRNGRLSKNGGRPFGAKKRTLAECLLRRSLTSGQHHKIQGSWARLTRHGGNRSEVASFKRIVDWDSFPESDRTYEEKNYNPLITKKYNLRKKLTSEQQLFLKQLRVSMRHFLNN